MAWIAKSCHLFHAPGLGRGKEQCPSSLKAPEILIKITVGAGLPVRAGHRGFRSLAV
ncbi:MAG: hypothetical protein IIC64_06230 [SAR324 cluster bacterium]|nr:hypothetical protein [SAR324 cluster bacterium]